MNLKDPISYLDNHREDILHNLTEENTLSNDEALFIFNECERIIILLKGCRSSRRKTINSLKQNLAFDNKRTYKLQWILKAIQNNDSYYYGYKHLAQEFNRTGGDVFYNVDVISELDLLEILEKEDGNMKKDKTKEQSFTSLFRDKENAKKVKDIFENNGFTKDGLWIGETNNKTELLRAYHSLKNKGVLKEGKITPQGIIFYNEFGLEVPGYISERSIRTTLNEKDTEWFDGKFSSIE